VFGLVVVVIKVVPTGIEVGVENKIVAVVIMSYLQKEMNLTNLVSKVGFVLEGSIATMLLVDTKWQRDFAYVSD
jgi:hypothetical protein